MTSAGRTIGPVNRINLSSVVGCLSENTISPNGRGNIFKYKTHALFSLFNVLLKKKCRNFYVIYKIFFFHSYLYNRNVFFSTRDFFSVRLNEPFFLFFFRLHGFALLVRDYCCRGICAYKIRRILLLFISYGPRESGSSLCFSFFVADRKQLQIAGGIAAHGAQQTEVSENKMRAQQSRRNNKCNAGEVITEGNRHLDKNSKNHLRDDKPT